MAVEHLIGHGHRRIAHLAGPAEVVPFRLRLEGYREAIAAAGLPADDTLVAGIDSESGTTTVAMTALLAVPDPPTAVFVANDRMAIEALEFCVARGIRVPEELAVIGFDNVWVGRLSGVALTTVDSKAREVGRTAAEVLARRIRARHAETPPPVTPPERVVLRPELIVRRSCGCEPVEKDDEAIIQHFF
jgi:LacI family transcriptional regulator